jgi:hypothetical protein
MSQLVMRRKVYSQTVATGSRLRVADVAKKDLRSEFWLRPISTFFCRHSIAGDDLSREELARFEAAKLEGALGVGSLLSISGISINQKPLLGYPKSSIGNRANSKLQVHIGKLPANFCKVNERKSYWIAGARSWKSDGSNPAAARWGRDASSIFTLIPT